MPASFLKRHRTICNVLEEIRSVKGTDPNHYTRINMLVDEAKSYAESMSAKLVEYKRKEKERDVQTDN